MKNKKLWFWLAIGLLVALFVAVVTTSVLLSQKKDDLNNLPNVENIITLKQNQH